MRVGLLTLVVLSVHAHLGLVPRSLCTPAPFKKRQNTMAGPPFRLVRAIPVDMFPHTPHTELVALFERD